MDEYNQSPRTNEILQKIRMLKKVKFVKGHYHPAFLERQEYNVLRGRGLGHNAEALIERSFARRCPGGLKNE